MAHWKALATGDYMAAVEFGSSTFTGKVSEVRAVKLEQENGKQKHKVVIFFEGNDRGWVSNSTNNQCMEAMFGGDVKGWVGKRITLYAPLVTLGGEKVPGIRVKGSPDITERVECTVKLPRKKPFKVPLVPTGNGANGAARPQQAAQANGAANGTTAAPPPATAAKTDPEPPPNDAPPPDEGEPRTDDAGDIDFH